MWSASDWISLPVYLAILLYVGFKFKERAGKNLESFFLANRCLTVPILLGTAAASWYESWTVVGLGTSAWELGIFLIFFYVAMQALVRIPLATWIGPYVRDSIPAHVVTLPDLIAHLYDKKSAYVGGVMVVTIAIYSGALLFAIGEVLHLVTGLPLFLGMVIAGAVVGIYTAAGGLYSVAVTDCVQWVIMAGSAGLAAFYLYPFVGGWEGLSKALVAQDPRLLSPIGTSNVLEAIGWSVSALALYVHPTSYQRFSAARRSSDVAIAFNLMQVFGITFSAVMVMIGVCSRALYPTLKPATGFWTVILSALPAGLRGLFVAALTAAVMSTVDTEFLISSTTLVKNFYKEIFRPTMSESDLIRVNRYVIYLYCVLMVGLTQLWYGGISRAWYYIGGFLTSVFFVPLVAGLLWKGRTASGCFIALVASLVFYSLWEFILGQPFGFPTNLATWLFSALVYFPACLLTQKSGKAGRVEPTMGGSENA